MTSPSTLNTGRMPMTEIGIWTMWLPMDATRATTLTGVTPVNDASAVVVVRIHPQPVPEMRAITSMVASAMTPASAVCATRRRTDAPGPAHTQPKNNTPSAAGDFTPAASAHRMIPGTVPTRLATARPAMSRPTIKASLWAPPSSASRTSGEPAPRSTAWAGSRFSERASVGVAATIKADAGQRQQAQQHQVGQDLVARGLVEHAVGGEERRPVGRLGVRPNGVGHLVERCGPEDARPVRGRG